MGKSLISLSLLLLSTLSLAERPKFTLTIKGHLFYPDQLVLPANTKVKLIVLNEDDTPEQFDSFDLNREKVIFPHSQGVIFIGPLAPGEYDFFGEYHQNSALGKIIVKGNENVN